MDRRSTTPARGPARCGWARGLAIGAVVAVAWPVWAGSPTSTMPWLDARDATLIDAAGAQPPALFRERPGSMEFSGRMIVRPHADLGDAAGDDAIPQAIARLEPLEIERFVEVNELVVRLPDGMDENAFAAFLMATGDYEYAHPDWLCYPLNVPNDPQFDQQWHHERLQSTDAWTIETGGSGTIVAIIDTGTDLSHPDLADSLIPGFNAKDRVAQADGGEVGDVQGHGTFVTGSAAAIGDNEIGVVGVGWNFSIMPIRIMNEPGPASLTDILYGARWAADNGADVINVSFSGVSVSSVQTTGAYVKEQGALSFWGSGNDGENMGSFDHPDVVVVGATRENDTRANFSNYGVGLDLVAPGRQIRSTRRGGGFGNDSGTSYSSPIAAGVGALIRSVEPMLTADQVQRIVYATTDELGDPLYYGRGRVNSFKAVTAATEYIYAPAFPFVDTFDATSLDESRWAGASQAEVVTNPNAPSGDRTLRIEAGGEVRTRSIPTDDTETLHSVMLSASASNVGAGQALTIEARPVAGEWTTLGQIEPASGFSRHELAITPELTDEPGVQIRLVATSGSGVWDINDVLIDFAAPLSLPFADAFIDSTLNLLHWRRIDANRIAITDEAPGTSAPPYSMRIGRGGFVETGPILADGADDLTLTFHSSQRNAASHDQLRIEYRDPDGEWQSVAAIAGPDSSSTTFVEHSFTLPTNAAHDNLALSFANFGFSSNLNWYIDDIRLAEATCIADWNGDGEVDINDFFAYLADFESGDPRADLNNDGEIDINDFFIFLQEFEAGC